MYSFGFLWNIQRKDAMFLLSFYGSILFRSVPRRGKQGKEGENRGKQGKEGESRGKQGKERERSDNGVLCFIIRNLEMEDSREDSGFFKIERIEKKGSLFIF